MSRLTMKAIIFLIGLLLLPISARVDDCGCEKQVKKKKWLSEREYITYYDSSYIIDTTHCYPQIDTVKDSIARFIGSPIDYINTVDTMTDGRWEWYYRTIICTTWVAKEPVYLSPDEMKALMQMIKERLRK